MSRKTVVTSEATLKIVEHFNSLKVAGFITTCKGNTIYYEFPNEFKCAGSMRIPGTGHAGRTATNYTSEQCIASLAKFWQETNCMANNMYNSWAKSPDNKATAPNSHAVSLTLGIWPMNAIAKIMCNGFPGKTLNDFSPDEIISVQEEINSKLAILRPVAKVKVAEEVEVKTDTDTDTE